MLKKLSMYNININIINDENSCLVFLWKTFQDSFFTVTFDNSCWTRAFIYLNKSDNLTLLGMRRVLQNSPLFCASCNPSNVGIFLNRRAANGRADGEWMCVFVQVVCNRVNRWTSVVSVLSSDTGAISDNISHRFLSLIFPVLRLLHFFTCHLEQKEKELI